MLSKDSVVSHPMTQQQTAQNEDECEKQYKCFPPITEDNFLNEQLSRNKAKKPQNVI